MVFFSIITVTYNAEKEIISTLDSIFSQTCSAFEFVLIDGKSSDNTVEMVNDYICSHGRLEVESKIISEKDSGIYNAMNKGIDCSNGKYVVFLNSGDRFVDENVLEKARAFIEQYGGDIVYGDTILSLNGLSKYVKAKSIDNIIEEMPFCHQSTFTSNSVLKSIRYDESYRVCADHDLYTRAYLAGHRFIHMDLAVAVYPMGGFSATDDALIYWKERAKVAFTYGGYSDEEYSQRIRELEKYKQKRTFINKIKTFIPSFILSYRRKRVLKKEGWH